jgi:hypothetical protein
MTFTDYSPPFQKVTKYNDFYHFLRKYNPLNYLTNIGKQ